jgi:hypothetical protein
VSKRLLVLGGGFGLYGYLPAALQASWDVSILSRYRNLLLGRVELPSLLDRVMLIEESNLDVNSFEAVVIARSPSHQFEFIHENSSFKGHYFLEKPLGPSPALTFELLNILESRKSTFSVAYLFRFQEWYKEILAKKELRNKISIKWRIAPLQSSSWKNDENLGGGLLSYYGVHLLSLIVELQCDINDLDIEFVPNMLTIRSKSFLRFLEIDISITEIADFQVNIKGEHGEYNWCGLSPFGLSPTSGIPDPRIPALTEYLSNPLSRHDRNDWILHERKILNLRQIISEVL